MNSIRIQNPVLALGSVLALGGLLALSAPVSAEQNGPHEADRQSQASVPAPAKADNRVHSVEKAEERRETAAEAAERRAKVAAENEYRRRQW